MEQSSSRWTTVADSPHDHEREALAFLRRYLPDREPYHVWSNFEFVAPSGALYEVDALAVTDNGVHLIEIKSHPGAIGGDGSTWQWTTPQGKVRLFDNPRLLANRKAKALKEVLGRTKEFARRRNELPYVTEAVFLSDPDLVITLSPPGRYQVYGRDQEKAAGPGNGTDARGREGDEPARRPKLQGVVEALTTLDADRNGRPRRRVDRPLGARIARAVEQAGIRERTSRRRIGNYRLVELLDDVEADRDTGVAYQDFLVAHVSVEGIRRRLRLYPLEQNATTEQREVAERAAKREFEYLFPLDHPGVLAPREFIEHERCPCLLFDADPAAQRLDRWVARGGLDRCGVAERIETVRALAEALAHAHGRGVFHRALSPSAVLVTEPGPDAGAIGAPGMPQVTITNWHAGARVGTGESTAAVTGTQHVEALSGGDAALYRAPEFLQPLADPARLDVFSLGCLACFVFTGAPPAASPGKLDEMLLATGHVAADVAGEPVDDWLALFVASLTDKDPDRRPRTMADVLALLDQVEAELTAPDPAADEPHVTAARRGVTLGEGRFEVLGRIGLGSAAFALLVRDNGQDGRVAVLKVARTPDHNDRIAAEGTALGGLRHPSIVQLLDGPLDLDGHAALLLSYAGPKVDARPLGEPGEGGEADDRDERGDRTLASRIGEPLGAELAERFGEDLLDAVRHLEQMGVAHRDIKPENLGIAPRGDKNELHLVLFDFSLAGAPIDRVDAGTPGYLEPSLWRACGLTRLWSQGHVEPIVPPPLPAHLVAHQLLALALQEGAVGRSLWREWLGDPFVFGEDVSPLDDAVVDHLTGHGFLSVDSGMLSIGREAEARFGRRHSLDLTSVFTAPPVFTILAGRREIGHVHDLGIMAAFQVREGPPVLLLGGRGWRILDVDWRRRRVEVELTDRRGRTRYHGAGRPLDDELCQSIAAVLAGDDPAVPLSRRAQAQLDDSRSAFPSLRPADATLLRRPTGQSEWWTFAGLRANLELAARLGPITRSVAGVDDLSIALTDDTMSGDLASSLDRQTPVADLLNLADEVVAGVKFADCLPTWLADAVVLARVSDSRAVEQVLARRIDEAFVT